MGRSIAALWIAAAFACGGGDDPKRRADRPTTPPKDEESVAALADRNCGPTKTYEREFTFVETGADRTLRFRPLPSDTAWKGDLVLPIPPRPLAVALEPGHRYKVTWNPGCDGRLNAVERLD